MFTFQTRFPDMTFEGIPAKGPSIRASNGIIQTSDEAIAKALRTRKDVWEITDVPKIVAEAKAAEAAIVEEPKRPPGRPKGVRGSRTVDQTQGE
jgi:hypothetical protein